MLYVHLQRCGVSFVAQIIDVFLLDFRVKVSYHHCFSDLQFRLTGIPHWRLASLSHTNNVIKVI